MRELSGVGRVDVYRVIVVLVCFLNIAYELYVGYFLYFYYNLHYIRILSVIAIIVDIVLLLGLLFKLRMLEITCTLLFLLSCACYTLSFIPPPWRAFLRATRRISDYLFTFFIYDILFIGCFPGYLIASLLRLVYSKNLMIKLWIAVLTYIVIGIISFSLYKVIKSQ